MVQAAMIGRRQRLLIGLLFSAMVLSAFWQRQAADAQNSELTGSAYGHFADVTLFDAQQPVAGPAPTVTLPAAGGDESASAPSASVVYGPANLFTSGPLTVATEGTAGSVTSTATIENVNTSGQEIFTADNLASTCTASEGDVSGSSTITNGTLITNGGDPDVEGDETVVEIPTDPDPNTAYEGTLAPAVNDNFRYVFNEQIENPDGSLTVNAVHGYLLGPTAVGDIIAGQVVCGVSTGSGEPGGDTTTTTTAQPGGGSDQVTTTTMARRGSTATTVAPSRPAPTTPAQPRFTG